MGRSAAFASSAAPTTVFVRAVTVRSPNRSWARVRSARPLTLPTRATGSPTRIAWRPSARSRPAWRTDPQSVGVRAHLHPAASRTSRRRGVSHQLSQSGARRDRPHLRLDQRPAGLLASRARRAGIDRRRRAGVSDHAPAGRRSPQAGRPAGVRGGGRYAARVGKRSAAQAGADERRLERHPGLSGRGPRARLDPRRASEREPLVCHRGRRHRPGIGDADGGRIFDPFFTTAARQRPGLFNARRIVGSPNIHATRGPRRLRRDPLPAEDGHDERTDGRPLRPSAAEAGSAVLSVPVPNTPRPTSLWRAPPPNGIPLYSFPPIAGVLPPSAPCECFGRTAGNVWLFPSRGFGDPRPTARSCSCWTRRRSCHHPSSRRTDEPPGWIVVICDDAERLPSSLRPRLRRYDAICPLKVASEIRSGGVGGAGDPRRPRAALDAYAGPRCAGCTVRHGGPMAGRARSRPVTGIPAGGRGGRIDADTRAGERLQRRRPDARRDRTRRPGLGSSTPGELAHELRNPLVTVKTRPAAAGVARGRSVAHALCRADGRSRRSMDALPRTSGVLV